MHSTIFTKLEVLRKNNSNSNWVNKRLYRLLYDKDLLVLAYENIKSKPGNMTKGSDGLTLDGISEEYLDKVIAELKNGSFEFKPSRRIEIPKKNGKTRKLGIPSPRDKIIQEALRIILESIYDSPKGSRFLDYSHGFRGGRSPHTALKSIRTSWRGSVWFVEGDISNCFDSLDHHILIDLLCKRIDDERFISLIWKSIRAGYVEFRTFKNSLIGSPQGSILSPILSNIYLHELDVFVDNIIRRETKGSRRRQNPDYRILANRKQRRLQKKDEKIAEIKELTKAMKKVPSVDCYDSNFVRVHYIRYADDWVVGVVGDKLLAEWIRREIQFFLKNKLGLTLNEEKTKITHARNGQAEFLGVRISCGRFNHQTSSIHIVNGRNTRKRISGGEIKMDAPLNSIVEKLHSKGFCDKKGFPIARGIWLNFDDADIVRSFSAVNRGLLNYYRFTDNFGNLNRIDYILRYSLAKTLSRKHRTSIGKIFDKYGRKINIKGENFSVAFWSPPDWKRRPDLFMINEFVDTLPTEIFKAAKSKLGYPCCVCGSDKSVSMHHVRHINNLMMRAARRKKKGFIKIMGALNRKQIPVCKKCHSEIHAGNYDGLKLSDLAYKPV
jgi:group II intron reverse transcriptase/maturase